MQALQFYSPTIVMVEIAGCLSVCLYILVSKAMIYLR